LLITFSAESVILQSQEEKCQDEFHLNDFSAAHQSSFLLLSGNSFPLVLAPAMVPSLDDWHEFDSCSRYHLYDAAA
jgi:hypothetical protein